MDVDEFADQLSPSSLTPITTSWKKLPNSEQRDNFASIVIVWRKERQIGVVSIPKQLAQP